MIVKEKMQECQTLLRWVSSEAQYADGMTKPSARQLLTDRLRTHMFKLQADEDFVAAKKKSQQQREANARKFALSKAASKIGGLAHLVFISHIMPVTGSSFDDATWSSDALRLLVTALMSFFTGCFCVWMLMGGPQVFQRAEPKRRAPRSMTADAGAQCEIEYEEMSHISYQLQCEKDDKQRLIEGYDREIEVLESYGQVMKDTADSNKENADNFLSELNQLKERLKEREQAASESVKQVIGLERQIYEVQDQLDRAKQAAVNMAEFHNFELEFRKEVYALQKATRFHLYEDCDTLMQARPVAMHVCKECEDRRAQDNKELDQYQQGW